MTRDACGRPLVAGYNADKVDVAAGMVAAKQFGYVSPEHLMVVEYALMRHRRGEEDGAEKSALSGGIDLTSWRVILAHALAAAADQIRPEDVPSGFADLAWSAFISAEGGNPERLRVVVAAVFTEAREAIASEIERVIGGYPENGITRPKIERGRFANDAEWAAKIAREWHATWRAE